MSDAPEQAWTGLKEEIAEKLGFPGPHRTSSVRKVAEREGFEPSIRFCRILTFQASAFDHSATAPQKSLEQDGI